MIGIDSNILLRFLLRDDEQQYQQVLAFFENIGKEQVYVNLVVLTEAWWVLDHIYDYTKNELIDTFELLLNSKEVAFSEADSIFKALNTFKTSKADFEDCLIAQLNTNVLLSGTYTFDKKASKLKGMKLLK